MDLKNMLRERSQTKKGTYYMIPYIRNIQNRQICRERKQTGGYQWLRGEEKWGEPA